MIFGSVCSGIEAASVAWEPLGWRASFLAEIDPFPRSVLAHHYPTVPVHGDFTTIQEGDYAAAIDVLVGGTPCQDFSVAGKRAGMDGERGNLTLEYARLAHRLRPTWLVWENVPGVFSLNSGRDFGAVIACFAGYPEGSVYEPPEDGWKNSGIVPPAGPDCYGLAWTVRDAQYFGVPQRRRRVFIVGYLGDWRPAAAVLLERHGLSGHPPPRRQAGQGIAPTIAARTRGGGGLGTDFDCDGGLIANPGEGRVADSLTVGANQCSGFPGDFVEAPPITMAHGQGGAEIGFDRAPSLTCNHEAPILAHTLRGEGFDAGEDGTGRGTPLIPIAFDTTQITSPANYSSPAPGDSCHPLAAGAHLPAIAFSIMPMNSGKDYKAREVDVAQPLMAGGPVGGNQGGDYVVQPTAAHSNKGECKHCTKFFSQYRCGAATHGECDCPKCQCYCECNQTEAASVTYAIQGNMIGRGDNAGPGGKGWDDSGVSFTQTKTDIPAVAYAFQPRIARNDRGDMGDIVNALSAQSGESGKGDAAPCVAVAFQPEVPDVAGTLLSNRGSGGWSNNVDFAAGGYMVPVAVNGAIDGDVSATMRSGNGNEHGGVPSVMQPVAFEENFHAVRETAVAPAMTTEGYRPSQNAGGLGIRQHYAVRRLTPRECERLQGFPDDWTLVPHRGKPASDGPRYKALGNSMAVPVMRWIGERIELVTQILRDREAAA